jgi:hypothetical protein
MHFHGVCDLYSTNQPSANNSNRVSFEHYERANPKLTFHLYVISSVSGSNLLLYILTCIRRDAECSSCVANFAVDLFLYTLSKYLSDSSYEMSFFSQTMKRFMIVIMEYLFMVPAGREGREGQAKMVGKWAAAGLFVAGWVVFPGAFVMQKHFWFKTTVGTKICRKYGFSEKDCMDISNK